MPPVADKQLEERIVTAARQLWREQGDKGLTLRAVARAAGTTTPTVYKRFRNKEAIRLALALRIRAELNAELFASSCLEEVFQRYLAYAEANPREYDLLRLSWAQFYTPDLPRPGRAWVSAHMAARFGGRPEDYGQIVDALSMLCHGTATVLTVGGSSAAHKAMREACLKFCDQVIEHIEVFRSRE
ncbi:MAG: TetR/AcrR family transcriptional regulator [Acidobacteriia bacterium]|nr:TetR/AcrR family transcriptional regulator [Terriglobia bacterium]